MKPLLSLCIVLVAGACIPSVSLTQQHEKYYCFTWRMNVLENPDQLESAIEMVCSKGMDREGCSLLRYVLESRRGNIPEAEEHLADAISQELLFPYSCKASPGLLENYREIREQKKKRGDWEDGPPEIE